MINTHAIFAWMGRNAHKVREYSILISLVLSFFLIIMGIFLLFRSPTASVNADTRYVQFRTSNLTSLRWALPKVSMNLSEDSGFCATGEINCACDALLDIAKDTFVEVIRIKRDMFSIILRPNTNGSRPSTVISSCTDNAVSLDAQSILFSSLSHESNSTELSLTLPIHGISFEIGKDLSNIPNIRTSGKQVRSAIIRRFVERIPTMLESGHIAIHAETVFFGKRYKIQDVNLDTGDRLNFRSQSSIFNQISKSFKKTIDGVSDSPASGFLKLTAEPMITVVAHARTSELEINRRGTTGYTISVSPWQKISQEPLVQLLVGFISAAVILITVCLQWEANQQNGLRDSLRNPRKGTNENPGSASHQDQSLTGGATGREIPKRESETPVEPS